MCYIQFEHLNVTQRGIQQLFSMPSFIFMSTSELGIPYIPLRISITCFHRFLQMEYDNWRELYCKYSLSKAVPLICKSLGLWKCVPKSDGYTWWEITHTGSQRRCRVWKRTITLKKCQIGTSNATQQMKAGTTRDPSECQKSGRWEKLREKFGIIPIFKNQEGKVR